MNRASLAAEVTLERAWLAPATQHVTVQRYGSEVGSRPLAYISQFPCTMASATHFNKTRLIPTMHPYDTTPFLLNLGPSGMDEPCITNDEFLDSLHAIGVWLRVLSAHDSLTRFASRDSTRVQRLAALSNIYLQLGAQLEDEAITLIAFSVWSKNRDLVLADLFSRIFVRLRGTRTTGSQIKIVHEKLTNDRTGSVHVDQRAFFQEVSKMTDAQIIEFFLGYRWRAQPSVRLLPSRHIEVWKNLPGELHRIAGSFHDEGHVPRITAAYNKLKHGPQLVLQNPLDRARRFASPRDLAAELAQYESLDKLGVRLLFSGARTQREPTDASVASIAPFLLDDERAVNKLFFGTMVYQASLCSLLVKMQIALYRKTLIDLDDPDDGIARIVEQAHFFATSG